MATIDKLLAGMRRNPAGVRFEDVVKVCERFFGAPRQSGSSHVVLEMPWPGDPRINLQRGKDGYAKPYQVRQAQIRTSWAAIDRLASGGGPSA